MVEIFMKILKRAENIGVWDPYYVTSIYSSRVTVTRSNNWRMSIHVIYCSLNCTLWVLSNPAYISIKAIQVLMHTTLVFAVYNMSHRMMLRPNLDKVLSPVALK